MNKERDFFGEVFQHKSSDDTKQLYDDWAEDYEKAHADMGGYLAPRRCAEALARFVGDKTQPVLDIGCGTGLAGVELKKLGFTCIDGTDISSGMLEQARKRNDLYRNLFLGDLNDPLPVSPQRIDQAVAAGVLSPAHAPASTMVSILDLLPVKGCFSFSLNDHSLDDPSYQATIDRLVSDKQAKLLFREHGINVPGSGLYTTVIVLQKC